MNIISCNKCGVILDKDKLRFPKIDYDDMDKTAEWDGHDWVAKTKCPVCDYEILETDK